jgi:hypothetical protein
VSGRHELEFFSFVIRCVLKHGYQFHCVCLSTGNSIQYTGLMFVKLYAIDLHDCVHSIKNLRPLVRFMVFMAVKI